MSTQDPLLDQIPDDPRISTIRKIAPVIGDMESGGRYEIRHPKTKSGKQALGKYGILPDIWWKEFPESGLTAGRQADEDRFLSSPQLQDAMFQGIAMRGLTETQGNLRKFRAWYYGGPAAAKRIGSGTEYDPHVAYDNDSGKELKMPSWGHDADDFLMRLAEAGVEFDAPNDDPLLAQIPSPGGEKPAEGPDPLLAQIPDAPQMPSLETYQPPAVLPGVRPNGMPLAGGTDIALPPQVAGPEPPPPSSEYDPILNQMPKFEYTGPMVKPTPEQALQAAGAREPPSSVEFGGGLVKGAAKTLSMRTYNPKITDREAAGAEMGTLAAGMLPALAGPVAGPVAMAGQALINTAQSQPGTPGISNPVETGGQMLAQGALGAIPGAVGGSAGVRAASGAGIGAGTSTLNEILVQLAQQGKVDLTDPESIKNITLGTALGMVMGGHGEAGGKEILHPHEQALQQMRQEAGLERMQDLTTPQAGAEPQRTPPLQGMEAPATGAPAVEPLAAQFELFEKLKSAGLSDEQAHVSVEALQHRYAQDLSQAPMEVRVEGQEPAPMAPEGAAPQAPQNPAYEKMAHEVTRSEYYDLLSSAMKERGQTEMPRTAFTEHKQLVDEALMNGHTVPENVLADYPDLKALRDASVVAKKTPDAQTEVALETRYSPEELETLEGSLDLADFHSFKKASEDIGLPDLATSSKLTPLEPGGAATTQPPPSTDLTAAGTPPTSKKSLPPAAASVRGSKTGMGIPEKVPPGKAKGKGEERLYHVGDYAKNILAQGGGGGTKVLRVNPADMVRLGLYKGEVRNPSPMNAFEMSARMGMAVTRDAAAPTLQTIADRLNEHYSEMGKEPIRFVGGEPDTYGFTADGIAEALVNRPKTKHLLDQQMEEARQKGRPDDDLDKLIEKYGTGEEADLPLYQKGPPKTNQEDMFGNKGRVASQGLMKGKVPDKGLEGSPMDLAGKADEQAKAEEGQQKLFQGNDYKPGVKGSYHYDKALQKHVITLVKGEANFSTFFHEYFHYLDQAKILSPFERDRLVNALQGSFKSTGSADILKGGRFTEKASERAARWFERFLRDGKVPVPELKPIFEKIKTFIREVYQSLRGSPLEEDVPTSAREAFESIFGAKPEEARTAGRTPKDAETLYQKAKAGEPLLPEAPFQKERAAQSGKGAEIFAGQRGAQEVKKASTYSGFLTPAEIAKQEYHNEAEAIEKVDKIAMAEQGKKYLPYKGIRILINRVFGAGGSAEHYMKQRLDPIFNGLSPADQRLAEKLATARDHAWRYKNTEDFNNNRFTEEDVIQFMNNDWTKLLKDDPIRSARISSTADKLSDYFQELSYKKLLAGVWSQAEYERFMVNPSYIEDIRLWEAASSEKDPQLRKGSRFSSKNKLIHGTFEADVDPPLLAPMAAAEFATKELWREAAKRALGNRLVDTMKGSPAMKDWIERKKTPDQKALPTQGEIQVLRDPDTHLTEAQERLAKALDDARNMMKKDRDTRGPMAERGMIRRLHERAERLHPRERDVAAEPLHDILHREAKAENVRRERRLREAQAVEERFNKLPKEERDLIEDWLDERRVQTFFVPKEMADAVNGMGLLELKTFEKVIGAVSNFFKRAVVSWNPSFPLKNFPRDIQEAYYNVGMPPWYAFKGFLHYMKQDATYDLFTTHGGRMDGGGSGFQDAAKRGEEVRYPGWWDKLKDPEAWKGHEMRAGPVTLDYGQFAKLGHAITRVLPAHKLFEASARMSEAMEMATRLGVMDYAMNKGVKEGGQRVKLNADEATALAREATLDFQKMGSKIKHANHMIPFLAVRINAIEKMYRTAKDNPVAAASRAFLMLAPAAILTLAWNMMNPEYADIPAREKQDYWILMFGAKGGGHLRIAKGGLAKLLVNPLQLMLETWVGTANVSKTALASDLFEASSPVSDESGFLNPVFKWGAEEVFNHSLYRDRDIVQTPQTPSTRGYEYDQRTAETFKVLGKALNWSPARMQHTAESFAGGTANNVLFVTDMLLKSKAGGWQGVKDYLKDAYIPVVNAFFDRTHEWKGDLEAERRKLEVDIKKTQSIFRPVQDIILPSKYGKETNPDAVAPRQAGVQKDFEKLLKRYKEVTDGLAQLEELRQAAEKQVPFSERLAKHPFLERARRGAAPSPKAATPSQTSGKAPAAAP